MKTDFRNIIFDFGGVIIRIEYERIAKTFRGFGLADFDLVYSKVHQSTLFDDFEKGKIEPPEFRDKIREVSGIPLTDEQIDEAWNAILIGIPEENLLALERLKKDHRLFLLSNTNAIHEKAFTELMIRDHGRNVLDDLFEKVYFSHNLNMRKPDEEIFLKVLQENNLLPGETLFVDDSPQHIKGAAAAGLHTLFAEKGKMVADLF